ncbi:ATP-binding protein [Terasakiella pusilla]|uniref:ATP-binding protein n=1 Tax=Terasakiella pusilla TaxID=64973 RepID=UPI00068C2460|nr:ATP-binding protein [Terasakiella pusilla]
MTFSMTHRFEARTDHLKQVMDEVEVSVQKGELSGALGQNVMLCLDELLTNIIKYGENEKGSVSVELDVREEGKKLKVFIKDDGPAFNPFEEVKEPDIDADLEDRMIGGLGVYFVKQLSESYCYSYIGRHNVVALSFDLQ